TTPVRFHGFFESPAVGVDEAEIDEDTRPGGAERLVAGPLAEKLLEEIAGLPQGDPRRIGLPPLAEDVGAVDEQACQVLADDGERAGATAAELDAALAHGVRSAKQRPADRERLVPLREGLVQLADLAIDVANVAMGARDVVLREDLARPGLRQVLADRERLA